MTMFPMLDDPNPPLATTHTLTRVHTRARILRRRRRIAAAAPAVLAVGVAGAIVPRLRAESPEQVATITVSTLPPATGFGLPTTTPPFDDRGEVFRFTEVPAGWELAQERTLQVPEARQFERTWSMRRPNGVDPVDPTDPFDRFSIVRYEGSALDVERQRTAVQQEGPVVTTPGGRGVVLFEGANNRNLTWFVNDNVYIQVNSSPAHELDLEAVVDSIEYTPGSPSCFDGEAVRIELAACGPLDVTIP